jgi:hypothetical protein
MGTMQKLQLGPRANVVANGGGGGQRQWRSADDDDPLGKWAAAAVHGRGPRSCTNIVIAIVATASIMLLLLHPGASYYAQETARSVMHGGGPQHGADGDGGAFMHPSSDRHGLCRLEYTVKTWDGKNARVCDPSVCVGREKLKLLKAAGSPRRWSAYHESAYMRMYNGGQISGWLKVRAAAAAGTSAALGGLCGLAGSNVVRQQRIPAPACPAETTGHHTSC